MDIQNIIAAGQEITAPTLPSDPRLAKSPNREIFLASAKAHKMSIWSRDETTKDALRPVFLDIYRLAQDPSKDLATYAWLNNQGTLDLEIPQTMIDVGAAEEIRGMAETYFHLNKSRRFEVRPTTVLHQGPHDHHDSVLSASWGGNGLIVRNGNTANQLLEGDWGFLHWDLVHESPPRNVEEKRVVMVAKRPER